MLCPEVAAIHIRDLKVSGWRFEVVHLWRVNRKNDSWRSSLVMDESILALVFDFDSVVNKISRSTLFIAVCNFDPGSSPPWH